MTRLAVTGYASLDYPLGLDGFATPDTTTRIARRDENAWPRVGGCPSFVAMAAAREGLAAAPITWVGADGGGKLYAQRLAESGVEPDGIATVASARSPTSVLVYQKDGSCICLYDPAFAGRERLTERQHATIAAAEHLCVTVGPPQLLEQICEARARDARLYWVVKNDPLCFPPELRNRLADQADVIFCNESERTLVAGLNRPDTIIVETHGSREVVIECDGSRHVRKVTPLDVSDTTGAGDTLAGGFIGAMMRGETDPRAAADAGIRAVHAFLSTRIPTAREDA